MAIDTHHKVAFANSVRLLAGGQMRSLLWEFTDKEMKTGEVVFLDSYGLGDDATSTELKDVKRRSKSGLPTDFAEQLAMSTPHMDITRDRTLSGPYLNEWGHYFDEATSIEEITDSSGRIMAAAMKKIMKKRDKMVFSAITAATVSRGKDAANVSAVAFPAEQKIDVANVGASGEYTIADISSVGQKYEDNYADDEQIFCIIAPVTKKKLIDASGDKIHSTDFVDKRSYFAKGKLPEIYGVIHIVYPPVGAKAAYAFQKSGIVANISKGLKTSMGESPDKRFDNVAYVREYIDVKRVDDKRVVWVTIDNT